MKRAFLLALVATVLSGPLAAASCKIVLAYYADWNKPGYSASTIPYSKLTHLCHAFVLPNADGSLNVGAGFLEPTLISGAHAAGVKVLVSIGGANGSAYFPGIAAGNRANFANSVRNFILTNNYDGVDIDWEFPNNATDRGNFNLMVQALRSTFTAAGHPEWLISGAFSSDLWQAPQYDLATLKNSLNFFNVMTYDYHGSWSSHMGHCAPLGRGTGDPDNISGQQSINYYLGQGVPASQLVYGLAFYGYDFPVEDLNNGCPGGNCGGTTYIGYLAAAADVGNGWTRYWDAAASSPYLRNNATAHTITYDDPQSIQAKSDWALNSANLGGVFMWELSQDYVGPNKQPLLDAMRVPLACGPTPTPTLTPTPAVFPIPGRIQAEDYAVSADSTAGNAGGAYRTGDTDVEATTDVGGGYDVGYTDVGEWLDYKVNVGAAGSYDFSFRVASANTTAMNLAMQWDGAALGGPVAIGGTTGWQAWADVKVTGLALSAGAHTLRILLGTGGYNLNYIDIYPTPQPSPTMTSTRTRTPLPSATRSSTATSTFTASASPSRTATGTATRTATPLATASASSSPTTSPQASATRSSTATASLTSSVTPPSTPTSTLTAAAVLTPSVSPSHSASPAGTPTATPEPSLSAAATNTATPSPTPTVSATASQTESSTPSCTGSATPGVTPPSTPTATSSAAASPIASMTRTATAQPALSATLSRTPSALPSSSKTSAPTAPASGGLIIQAAFPVPDPNPTIFYVQLPGWADSIELAIYSSANTLITTQVSGPHYPGWTLVHLPPGFLRGAANGTYFYTLQARRGGVLSSTVRGPLIVLH